HSLCYASVAPRHSRSFPTRRSSDLGAQFGFNMLWTMPVAFPLMAAMQSMCGRIGRVTGKGLVANIKLTYPPIVVRSVVLLLLIRSEEHTSELQSRENLVCRLLLEKK